MNNWPFLALIAVTHLMAFYFGLGLMALMVANERTR